MRIPVRQLLVATPVLLSASLLAISTGFTSIAGAAGSNYITPGGTVTVVTGTGGQTAQYAIQTVVSTSSSKKVTVGATVMNGAVTASVPMGSVPSGSEVVVAAATSLPSTSAIANPATAFFVGVYNKTTGVKNNSTFKAPITVVVHSKSIKVGDVAYALYNGVYVVVGTATKAHVITLTISQDPQILVGKARAMASVRFGSVGANVKTLQKTLNAHKTSPRLAVDGIFGKATLASVKAFQKSHKLTADGVVGQSTWTQLGL